METITKVRDRPSLLDKERPQYLYCVVDYYARVERSM